MLPKTTAEQRAALYEDVEALLSPGFLTLPIQVGEGRIHLRSFCPGDLFLLQARASGGLTEDWHLWTVASAIWMLDGVSLLGKDESIPHIRSFLRDHLRLDVLDLLYHQVLGLRARTDLAVEAIQAYRYEHLSRYRWRTSQRGELLSRSVPGSERLGPNSIQSIWMAFNEAEDQRIQDENHWEGIKFLASSNAPKAVKKIDDGDRQRRQSEEARRQAVLDRYYYYRHGFIDEQGYRKGMNSDALGSHIEGPKSVDDLEDEMRRWVSGEQDEHDRIVTAYKENIRHRQEAARADLEQRRQALLAEQERQWQEAPLRGPQPLVGLTAEQLQQTLAQRPQGVQGTRWIPDGPAGGWANFIYENWVGPREDAGLLQVQEGRLVAPAGSDPRRDVNRLQALVDQRKVQFGGGEG